MPYISIHTRKQENKNKNKTNRCTVLILTSNLPNNDPQAAPRTHLLGTQLATLQARHDPSNLLFGKYKLQSVQEVEIQMALKVGLCWYVGLEFNIYLLMVTTTCMVYIYRRDCLQLQHVIYSIDQSQEHKLVAFHHCRYGCTFKFQGYDLTVRAGGIRNCPSRLNVRR